MGIADVPFNVSLLSTDKSAITGLFPVQSLDIFSTGTEFSVQGLYSPITFGEVGTKDRQNKFGFIDMRTEIMHPKVFLELTRLKGLYEGIASGAAYAIWDDKIKDFVKSDIIDGKTGYGFLMEHFNDIIHSENDSDIRDLRIKLLKKVHDKCMYRYLQVLPAGLRDLEIDSSGRPSEDEINNLYRKVLRAANAISIYSNKPNDPILNTVRWNLQKAFNDIYSHIESLISGKKGFLLGKFASRNIHGSTRNVITAADPGGAILGSKEAVTINDTICGLHQYLKGSVELSIYNIRNGPMMPVLAFLPTTAYVTDAKTLKRKQITPSNFLIDNWGTEDGIEKLINGYEKLTARHKPIIIDGDYAALLYRDHKHFKVFYDIGELPKEFSKTNVKPITWTEMFYISVYKQSKKVVANCCRYPIATKGSTYISNIYLNSTIKSESLVELDDNWKSNNNDPFSTFPIQGQPFVDSMSIHIAKTGETGADFD